MSTDLADAAAEVLLAWWTGPRLDDPEKQHLYQRMVRAVDVSGDLRATVMGDPVRGRSHLAAVLRDAAARHPVVASLVRQVAPQPVADARPSTVVQNANATGDGSVALNVGRDAVFTGGTPAGSGIAQRIQDHLGGERPAQAEPVDFPVVLLVSAQPEGMDSLHLGSEQREIREALERSPRVRWRLELRPAIRLKELDYAIRDLRPRVIHFSGHGSDEGGLFLLSDMGEAHRVPPDALADLFSTLDAPVECVVLNACFSETQAQAIAGHVPYVIGSRDAVADDAAIAFATGFYAALAAGNDIPRAHARGCAHFRCAGTNASPPELIRGTAPP